MRRKRSHSLVRLSRLHSAFHSFLSACLSRSSIHSWSWHSSDSCHQQFPAKRMYCHTRTKVCLRHSFKLDIKESSHFYMQQETERLSLKWSTRRTNLRSHEARLPMR